MENKLKVKICTGTMCYVMGGSELLVLEDYLSPEIATRVDVSGTPCLDICDIAGEDKAPFVKVGDKIVSDANISKVVAAIKEELNEHFLEGEDGFK